jgi:hypothetical protein
MMVHGRTETKSPKNVKKGKKYTNQPAQLNMSYGAIGCIFVHAATETATISIGMIAVVVCYGSLLFLSPSFFFDHHIFLNHLD